jgi:hypothetical protein
MVKNEGGTESAAYADGLCPPRIWNQGKAERRRGEIRRVLCPPRF